MNSKDDTKALEAEMLAGLVGVTEEIDSSGGSATAYSRDQLAKLAFAIFYSAVTCAPQNIEAVVKEIDCCPGCDHVSNGGTCYKSERGNFCPNDLAETLRQISLALYGPSDPTGYIASVFGPDKMTAPNAPQGAVGVKALDDWPSFNHTEYKGAFSGRTCQTVVGRYDAVEYGDWFLFRDGYRIGKFYPNFEAVVVAAQADFKTRIRSALASPPPSEARVPEGWRTMDSAPSGWKNYFFVRPKGLHPGFGEPFLPTLVQQVEGQFYAPDNELDPLYFGQDEPDDNPFKAVLEWRPIPADWLAPSDKEGGR